MIIDVPGRLPTGGALGSGRPWWRSWWSLGVAVLVVCGGGALLMYLFRPSVSISASSSDLASVSLGGPGTTLISATAQAQGKTVNLSDSAGALRPASPLPAGASVRVTVVARSPWWAAWWAGSRITKTAFVSAPAAHLAAVIGQFPSGGNPSLHFTQPIRLLRWTYAGITHTQQLTTPARTITIALPSGHPVYGTLQVSAARFGWESLSAPVTFTFFEGTGALAVATPAPGTSVLASAPITLSFSQPVKSLFGTRQPTVGVALLSARPAGRWSAPDAYTLRFQPAADALWPGQVLQVQLPAAVRFDAAAPTKTLSFPVAQGSVLRLQQELATLGYLPVRWTAATGQPGAPATVSAAARVAYQPPKGSFSWRWATPAGLAALWQPGQYGIMTEAAVKAFEHVSGLRPVGRANPLLWPFLARALAGNRQNPNGYTWVDVSKKLPETLTVWHNGHNVISALTNTGIPQYTTADGTFIVYLRYRSQIMRGTNPNGTKYADHVEWVSYFNGGDAIHGFVRASYGFPQSLGCAELPFATAQQVYPYTPIGTLVTVQ